MSDKKTTWSLFEGMSMQCQQQRQIMRGQIIICEGLPGVGKSYAVAALAKYAREQLRLNAVALEEEMRPMLLDYFTTNPKQHAMTTQITMLLKRGMTMTTASDLVKHDPDAVVFMDRSLAGDMAFAMMHHAEGNLSDAEWAVYRDESQAMVKQHVYRTPLLALYFTAADSTLKQRIWERGGADKDFYNTVDPSYLAKLDKIYPRVMCPEVLGCPVHVLPWEKDHRCFSMDYKACSELLDVLVTIHHMERQEQGGGAAMILRIPLPALPVEADKHQTSIHAQSPALVSNILA